MAAELLELHLDFIGVSAHVLLLIQVPDLLFVVAVKQWLNLLCHGTSPNLDTL